MCECVWLPGGKHIPHALPSQTVFDFLSQRHNRLCHFISDLTDYFWLAKTSNKPISLTTWLAVDPIFKPLSKDDSREGALSGNGCVAAAAYARDGWWVTLNSSRMKFMTVNRHKSRLLTTLIKLIFVNVIAFGPKQMVFGPKPLPSLTQTGHGVSLLA